MNQELVIEQEQTLSFEDICPNFSQIVSANGGFVKTKDLLFETDDGSVLDMGIYRSCVVGEAHGSN